jgi:U4/U6.U5 tri-snRNP-associated protein 3
VHIKLGKHDGETSSLRNETPADQQPMDNGRDAATPMDEDEQEDDIIVEDDGLDAMQAMMGFGSFGTTKGKKIAGNNVGAVRKEKKTEYRQYMNRVGGFNRPLDQI